MSRGTTDAMVERMGIVWRARLMDFGVLHLLPQREKLGITQQAMAERLGMHQSTVSRIERGCKSPRDYPTADAFAECYRLSKDRKAEWLA